MSMLVVTKGPVAIAGSISTFLKTKGVNVPTPVAIIIVEQILNPTTTPIIGSVFKKRTPANNPSIRPYNNPKIKPQAHSDIINQLPNTYGKEVDVMVEAKHKELAIQPFIKESYEK